MGRQVWLKAPLLSEPYHWPPLLLKKKKKSHKRQMILAKVLHSHRRVVQTTQLRASRLGDKAQCCYTDVPHIP